MVLQFLSTLHVFLPALAELQKAVPPPVSKKTAQQQTKEQRCSQLRGKVDTTKQQLAKLSKRRETLEQGYIEAGAKVEEKLVSLRIWRRNLKKLAGSSCSPTPPSTPPRPQAPRGHTSPRVSEVASSGMAVDAELLLPTDGEKKGPKRLRGGNTGEEEAPSLKQVLVAQDTFSAQDLGSIIHSFQPRWRRNKARLNNATWKTLLDGPGRMSSKPSLYFNTRQREGEFFNQGCGEKGTTTLTSGSGPCDTCRFPFFRLSC